MKHRDTVEGVDGDPHLVPISSKGGICDAHATAACPATVVRTSRPTEGDPVTAPRRALIVVDVQQEYFDGILQIQAPGRDQALANIVRAVDVAEAQGLPV